MMTASDRLTQQIAFIVEIDRLKTVLRQTQITDASRRENSAEHSWHLAVMAFVLAEHAAEPVDVLHVAKMVLIHDIVEIDAGDTFCYDPQANLDKAEREERAAARIFGLLPPDQAAEVFALWREFEERATPEARFANALDRFQPLLNNIHTEGGTWKRYGVTLEQIHQRCGPIGDGSADLWAYAQAVINEAVSLGYVSSVPQSPAAG